ncbi:MAG: hypothetical protein HOD63_13835 [Bacteroidetes bacterium]|jgi:hypothetical protein|nr:hypothetical protein [Bacteroidota bacterium]MBT5528131.1 hypothetical protein [Cytophagia bacterium]MBT3801042.1 hypothetical protein [Bacteroidota bacterium]MBT3935495.1 hypothetical protein [Bacteroidota bacterium]MBT4339669.1 hypothetical protein [Bacteroidota bacterium]
MDIQALKLELVRQILDLDSKEVLTKLFQTLKKSNKDFWLDLSESQKAEIELGLKQIENGETIEWEEFVKNNT